MSSYQGRFHDLSPSDQADIASWTEPPEPECELCGTCRDIDPDASDVAGLWVCVACVEAMLDAPADDARAEVGLVGGGGCRP